MIEFHLDANPPHILKDGICLATESPDELARMARIALHIDAMPSNRRITMIGGGTFILPRLLRKRRMNVFEPERDLVRFCPDNALFLHGDYRELIAAYPPSDVIVFDAIPETCYDEMILRAALRPGGILLR